MDLDSYIGRYSGETRLKRLLLIAESTADDAVAQRAYDLVEQQLRREGNVKRYKEVFGNASAVTATTTTTAAPVSSSLSSSSGGIGTSEQPSVVDDVTASATQPAPAGAGAVAGEPNVSPFVVAAPPRRRPNRPIDTEWIAMTESSNFNARQVLLGRLSSAQSHLHKEAIRTAYLALAEHDLQTGARTEGLSHLMRSMDYCTTRTQTAQISVVILEVALGLENYSLVRDYVTKVEHTVGAAAAASAASSASVLGSSSGGGGGGMSASNLSNNDILQEIATRLEIASGIERMVAGEYASAARILIPLVLRSGTNSNDANAAGGGNSNNNHHQGQSSSSSKSPLDWPGVTAPEDLALYASIMALVTQNRELTHLLAEHPEALELVPAVRDLLQQWSRSNYVQCIQAFAPAPTVNDAANRNTPDRSPTPSPLLPLGVDIYLPPTRWNHLAQKVRESCLVEYLRPYQCVRLGSMQQLFPTLGSNLSDVLVDLMSRGLLPNTRLDCRAGVLSKVPAPRDPTRQLQVMEETIMDDVHALLVRLACMDADLYVHDPNTSSNRRGGGARGRAAAAASGAGGRRGGPAAVVGGGGMFMETMGGSADSSDDDDDDDNLGGGDDDENVIMRMEETDTYMPDADAAAAMNPEDRY